MKYRLYIDEVGNSDLGASTDPNHRYLSLTGIIIGLDHVKTVLHPGIEGLKQRYFNSHPDSPIVFHRREMVRRLHPFHALNDPTVRAAFDQELLLCLQEWDYSVVSVTIDKLDLQSRYSIWVYPPYHYCLHVLLERYVMFLEGQSESGDVMAEARGSSEDRKLKESFTLSYERGTDYVAAQRFQTALTSREIKLKKKENNIAGLQLADIIAYPSYKSTLAARHNQRQPDDFSGSIIDLLLESKYLKNPRTNTVDGWGRNWLP